ncbi:MAG: glycosyltransferase [Burkholderiaceae bacterium]|nr:glycosyltransferase [Burkholderiaceae bacterium]
MKILCVFGRHNYGDPQRGAGYEYTNFLPALERLGHQIAFFESFDRNAWSGFPDLNRSLLATVEREQPDVVLCVLMGYEVWSETIDLIRALRGPILINWSTDDSWKYREFSRLIARHFDLYVTTDERAFIRSRRDGLDNFVLSQWAANAAALAAPKPAAQCGVPVSFVGTAYGNRPAWIAQLRGRGIDVQCFGHGWPRGAVPADEIPRIVRDSVISLNFGDSPPMRRTAGAGPAGRQIKARIFEVPGAGGFLITEAVGGIERYYVPGQEIAVFEGLDDLVAKIRHYLAHPDERDAAALRAFERTRREHTYDLRFADLLQRASTARAAHSEEDHKAMPLRIDWTGFGQAQAKHSLGPGLRLLRALLLLPFCAVWGRRRGPRAARRALFEISWRLAGSRTYSAAGLPGRLFYEHS